MIQEDFAFDMMPKVAELIKGNPVSFYDTSAEENLKASVGHFVAQNPSGTLYRIDADSPKDLPEHAVTVLSLDGVVMKSDFCGMGGTVALRHALIEGNQLDQVVSTVFKIDSPGGAVNGTFELHQAVAKSTKPVMGLVHGMAASAGYLAICGATEIHATHESCIVGSIGVMVTLRDYSEQLKEMGVREEVYTSRTSPRKNAKVREALAGDDTRLQKDLLMPLDALFMDAVKMYRQDVGKAALEGDDFLASKGMGEGLVDGIGSEEDIMERALDIGIYMKEKNLQTI
jgi:ClpP class serine protease